MMISDDPFAF